MTGFARTVNHSPPDAGDVRYVRRVKDIAHLTPSEQKALSAVAETYAFRANSYYLGLINWDDRDDPIRRIVIPHPGELRSSGHLDPSDESSVTVARGTEHKYTNTVLLLVSEVCGAYCRFCFRKRLFMQENNEVNLDISAGIQYIKEHPEVDNVLLTGGDALILGSRRLDQILTQLRGIPHIKIIRMGTKMPAFNPYRILNDPDLLDTIARHSKRDRRIYIMAHFNHPRELTKAAIQGINALLESGATVLNQTPLLRGINDDPQVLAKLCNKLSYIGVPPYYIFQGRPIVGNDPYNLTIREGYEILEEAKRHMSGLAKQVRFVMSHATGKIEILGFLEDRLLLKYHQAKDPDDIGRLFSRPYLKNACWLDDLSDDEEISSAWEYAYNN